MDRSLQLICQGSVKNEGNSSYYSPSWGLYFLLVFVLSLSSVAEMTSGIARNICLWLSFLEHQRNVKEGVINERTSFQILVFSIDVSNPDWYVVREC